MDTSTHKRGLILAAIFAVILSLAHPAYATPELSLKKRLDKDLTIKTVEDGEVIAIPYPITDIAIDKLGPAGPPAPTVKALSNNTSTIPVALPQSPISPDSKNDTENTPVLVAQIEGPDEEETPKAPAAEEDFFPIETPLLVNEAFVGDITAQVTMSGFAKVDVARFKTLMADRFSTNQMAALDAFTEDYVLLEEMQQAGFPMVFDPSELTIKLIYRVDGLQRVSVRDQSIENLGLKDAQEPANFSAGVSVVMRPQYVHQSQNGDTGFAPLTADIRGFVSLGGFKNWSLAYELNALEGREKIIRRNDITLIHDDFEKAIRYQIGDIRPSITGFQTSYNILGAGFERNYGAIQPFRNLRPGGRSTFTLDRPARVSYEVNGVILGTETFQPGDYDIRDLPLVTGSNDVRIIVDDEFGSREVGSYSTFVDTELLSRDTLLFGGNIGVLREGRSIGGYNYSDDFAANAFIEKGVSDRLTLGAQAEASKDGGYVGARGVVGLGSSLIAGEIGVSAFEGSDTGFSSAIRYTHRPFQKGAVTNVFSAQLAYQNEPFKTVGNRFAPRGEMFMASARNSLRYKRMNFNLDGSFTKTDLDEFTALGASLTLPVKNTNLSFGVRSTYSKLTDDLENRFFVSLSRNFGAYGTVRTRATTDPLETELEWRRLSDRSIGAFSARAGLSTGEFSDELSMDASYIASRAEFDVAHTTQFENGLGDTQRSVTDARVGVGLGFADGAFAFGRPLANGFAIIERHETLSDRTIKIERSDEKLIGKADGLGKGLVPLSGSYRNQLQRIAIDDLPPGYDIGASELKLFPSLNTGYRIQIGTDPAALVIGSLKTESGDPVKLAVGQLVPSDDLASEGISFFTNSTGRFVAEGVKAGLYQLQLAPDNRVITELDIGEGEDGVVQLGVITVKEDK